MIYNQKFKIENLKFKKAFLELKEFKAVVMRLRVNGKDAGLLAWRPWRWDISKLVRRGANKIEIEVLPSLRNLMGPHHLKNETKYAWHGAGEFTGWDDNFTEKYSFEEYGIAGSVKIAKYR